MDPTCFKERYGMFHSGHGELSHCELLELQLQDIFHTHVRNR